MQNFSLGEYSGILENLKKSKAEKSLRKAEKWAKRARRKADKGGMGEGEVNREGRLPAEATEVVEVTEARPQDTIPTPQKVDMGTSGFPISGPNFPISGPNFPLSGPNFPLSGPNFPISGPNYGFR